MSKQTTKPCLFGCHRLATRNSDICSTCKAGLRYWDNKDHADVLKREEHLQVLAARMHYKASARTRKTRRAIQQRLQSRAQQSRYEARV